MMQDLDRLSSSVNGTGRERAMLDDPINVRVARRYLQREASLGEWLHWMVQPFGSIVEYAREFVLGPVKKLIDDAIRRIAPKLLKTIAEQEVDADVNEFVEGAQRGQADRSRGRSPLVDEENDDDEDPEDQGYLFGYENNTAEIPPRVRKQVVETALGEFRRRVSLKFLIALLRKVWHAVNPVTTAKAIAAAVKKYGWKIGVAAALFELFEHFVLPTILTYITGNPSMMTMAALPLGEFIYPVVLRALGRAPEKLDHPSAEGHLDWYETTYEPVRLATAFAV